MPAIAVSFVNRLRANRKKVVAGLAGLCLLLVICFGSVHLQMLGWLRGEAFYLSRPTCYWRTAISQDFFPPFWLSAWHLVARQSRPAIYRPSVEAFDVLHELLQDPHDEFKVRETAIFCLGEIKEPSPQVVDTLKGFLADPNPQLKLTACLSLWKSGSEIDVVVPMLREEIANGNRPDALMGMQFSWPRKGAPFLIELLGHEDRKVKVTALDCLRNLSQVAPKEVLPGLPALKMLQQHPDERIWRAADGVIIEIAPVLARGEVIRAWDGRIRVIRWKNK